MPDLTRLAHGLDPTSATCRAIVESPGGRRAKYSYDRGSGLFALKRLLPEGMSFPLDFGFIPGTLGEDGDPLDILVLNDEPMAVGVLLEARLVGVILARQTEGGRALRNDRIIGVASASRLYARVGGLEDLGKSWLENVTQFWVNYCRLRGVAFEVLSREGAATACRLIDGATIGSSLAS